MNNITVVTKKDSPCWGSQSACQLKDLLLLIHRNTSIVFDSPQYLVLNKPADLRMDGEYKATVHKLLTYWYPPKSLLDECKQLGTITEKNDIDCASNRTADRTMHHTLLLELVSKIHRYSDIPDNFLRPCHQLDYATSGILLVAKTRSAAAHVSRLLETRHMGIKKKYIAIVVGNLKAKKNEQHGQKYIVPWTGGDTVKDVRDRLQLLEKRYRRSRTKVGKKNRREKQSQKKQQQQQQQQQQQNLSCNTRETFEGYQPAHSMFFKWKSKHMKMIAAPDDMRTARKKRRKGNNNSISNLLTDEDWQKIWEPVNKVEGLAAEGGVATIEIQKLQWKKLLPLHRELKKALVQASNIHNEILLNAIKKKQDKEEKENNRSNQNEEFPTFFQLPGSCDDCINTQEDNTFFIFCPLAEEPGHFRMVYKCADTVNNDISLDYKPSLTKCTVLEEGTLSIKRDNLETKMDVTKVLLHPITGRRHQLRVHMALAGFPILGDSTYGEEKERYAARIDSVDNNDQKINQKDDRRNVHGCSRMYLHAQSLTLPSLLGEEDINWKVTTKDPFLINKDGMLQLN